MAAEPEIIAAAEIGELLAAPEDVRAIDLLERRREFEFSLQSSSSSFSPWAKTKAARRGGGMGLSAPRIERQMTSFSSRSSAASSLAKSILLERSAPQAVFGLRSFKSTFADSR